MLIQTPIGYASETPPSSQPLGPSIMQLVTFVPLVLGVALAVALYVFWESIEASVLRPMLMNAMSKEFGTTVTLSSFQLRTTGVTFSGLEIANDSSHPEASFEAPYFAHVGSLQVKTSGLLSLMSCGGRVKIGSLRRKFVVGFLYRDIDEVLVEDVSIFVEDFELSKGHVVMNNAFLLAFEERNKAKRQRKFKQEAKMIREFKAKWRSNDGPFEDDDKLAVEEVDEADDSFKARLYKVGETMLKTKGQTFTERRDALKDLRDRFKAADMESKETAKITKRYKREQDATLWRIGRVSVTRCSVKIRGTHLHVDHWDLRGYIGDTVKLKRKVILGIMPELLGGVKDGAQHALDKRVHDAKLKVAHRVADLRSRFFSTGKERKALVSSPDPALS